MTYYNQNTGGVGGAPFTWGTPIPPPLATPGNGAFFYPVSALSILWFQASARVMSFPMTTTAAYTTPIAFTDIACCNISSHFGL